MNPLDTPVREAAWAAVDFESAGAAPGRSDEPVQVGMAIWRGAAFGDFFRSYIHSPVRITRSAQAVHGIADQDIASAPSMPALWPDFKARLSGAVVVAHGAGTEKRFLRSFPLHGFGPWLDNLAMVRAALPELTVHSLWTVTRAIGAEDEVCALCPGYGWHDALFDAVACLVILRRIVECCGLHDATVGELISADAPAYRRRRALLRTAKSAGWAD